MKKTRFNLQCFISVDGTDCKITERRPFNSKYFSFKFKGPGLKYEIGLSITTGRIVWVNGGIPCKTHDLTLARSRLVKKLFRGEKIIADSGYRDDRYFVHPLSVLHNPDFYKNVRARHENINFRIKTFKVIGSTFRHPLHKHVKCFFAVANIVQLKIDNGNPMARI